MCDTAGNLPPLSGIFPDYAAPIVRNHPDGRELMMARWGMPSPAFAVKGKKSDPGVTNVRNVKSPHWRRWLGVESRVSCLSPASPRMRRCRTAPTLRSGSPLTRRGLSLSSRASGQAGLASDRNKPDGLFVITPKMGLTFVENLPIEKFHGVGPATTTKMNRLGIETGLDLRARCFGMLSTASHFSMRRFGPFPRHSGALLPSTKHVRDDFAMENLGMYADDQYLFVVGPVEDADPPALREITTGAPEKIVLQFGRTPMFEAEDLAALRIDAGHHVPDGTIFSGCIHRLKDQQDGVAVGWVVKMLQRA